MPFPLSATVSWDALPATDGVLNYNVTLNGALVGSPTTTSLVISVPAAGTYLVGVSAVNQWGENTPTTVSVKINTPGQIVNIKIVKV